MALLKNTGLQRILALLDGDGEEARLVGGAVRNALLDKPATEFDIATTATPEVVAARAQAADLRAVPTGLAHGTVTVIVDGHPFEVTSLREDLETDGRHAVVRFSRDFAADAQRRDFTINALSLSRTARFTITSAASPTSPRKSCASSAIRPNGSRKIICASCASSAFPPAMRKARSMPTACSPASAPARDWRVCRASVSATNC